MTNPAATTFSSAQWQAKVEELQGQHQLELLQQQEEHLRLLHQLKAQLIKDIADANASGEAVPDPSQLLQALFLTEEIHTQAVPRTAEGQAISGDPLQSDVASQLTSRYTASPSRTSCAPSPAKTTEPSAGQRCDYVDSLPRTPTHVGPPECMPADPRTPPSNRSLAQVCVLERDVSSENIIFRGKFYRFPWAPPRVSTRFTRPRGATLQNSNVQP